MNAFTVLYDKNNDWRKLTEQKNTSCVYNSSPIKVPHDNL